MKYKPNTNKHLEINKLHMRWHVQKLRWDKKNISWKLIWNNIKANELFEYRSGLHEENTMHTSFSNSQDHWVKQIVETFAIQIREIEPAYITTKSSSQSNNIKYKRKLLRMFSLQFFCFLFWRVRASTIFQSSGDNTQCTSLDPIF